jgi:hypothetical protein
MGAGQDIYDGATQIAMFDPSGNLGPLQLGGYLEVQDVDVPTSAQGRMLYESAAIDWEQPNTGTSFYFMTVDKVTQKFDISNVQSINGIPPPAFTFYRGTFASSGSTGSQVVTLATPYPSTDYTALPVMADSTPAELSVVVLSGSQFEVYWQNASGGSHTFAWLTAG